jgi:hypothetical protein
MRTSLYQNNAASSPSCRHPAPVGNGFEGCFLTLVVQDKVAAYVVEGFVVMVSMKRLDVDRKMVDVDGMGRFDKLRSHKC